MLPKFRHLLKAHELTKRIFDEASALLEDRQPLMRERSMADAATIAAPISAKNQQGGPALAEHPFHIVKILFKRRQARCRGI